MPAERQLEFFPSLRRTAQQRKEWIQTRLDGLEYRQRAREQKRRLLQERRREREAGLEVAAARQLTIGELLERAEAEESDAPKKQGLLSRLLGR